MRVRLGVLYWILVALLLAMGIWWVFYLTQIGQTEAEIRKQKLANDRLHAAFLLQSDPQVAADPQRWLGEAFPQLRFRSEPGSPEVVIDPAVLAEIEDEARAKRNMFLYEGLFFLALLVAGSTILVISRRSENRFKQARELFLSGATHEFKTPLASLRLYTETLGREGLASEDSRRIRERMVQDISRLEQLVDEVLALSAADTFSPGPRERLDLAGECRLVLDDIRHMTRDLGADIELEARAGCFVRGQRMTLALTLRNLVLNAVRHSPDPVTVRVGVVPGSKWHQVVVWDNGPGIPRRLQKKVFECFFSTDGQSSRSGGLGLFLVKRNVAKMGGRIRLDSDEGRGCVFTISLPAVSAEHGRNLE